MRIIPRRKFWNSWRIYRADLSFVTQASICVGFIWSFQLLDTRNLIEKFQLKKKETLRLTTINYCWRDWNTAQCGGISWSINRSNVFFDGSFVFSLSPSRISCVLSRSIESSRYLFFETAQNVSFDKSFAFEHTASFGIESYLVDTDNPLFSFASPLSRAQLDASGDHP